MLATKPDSPGTGAGGGDGTSAGAMPPYDLAAATTTMVWACALATARLTIASTARGLELWSHVLRAPLSDPAVAGHVEADAAPSPISSAAAEPKRETVAAASPAPVPADSTPFASYRSAGGHAAAQVVVSE